MNNFAKTYRLTVVRKRGDATVSRVIFVELRVVTWVVICLKISIGFSVSHNFHTFKKRRSLCYCKKMTVMAIVDGCFACFSTFFLVLLLTASTITISLFGCSKSKTQEKATAGNTNDVKNGGATAAAKPDTQMQQSADVAKSTEQKKSDDVRAI